MKRFFVDITRWSSKYVEMNVIDLFISLSSLLNNADERVLTILVSSTSHRIFSRRSCPSNLRLLLLRRRRRQPKRKTAIIIIHWFLVWLFVWWSYWSLPERFLSEVLELVTVLPERIFIDSSICLSISSSALSSRSTRGEERKSNYIDLTPLNLGNRTSQNIERTIHLQSTTSPSYRQSEG